MKRSFLQGLSGSVLVLLAFSLVECVKAPDAAPAAPQASESELEAESLIRQSEAFSAAGDHTRAEQYLNLALTSGASEKRVLPMLVEACVEDQRYRDAVQYLENYLRRHPSEQKARFLLATLDLAIGSADRAKRELELVVLAQPSHADAHYALAVLFRDEIANYGEADRHFRAYLQLRPNGSHAEEARGSLLVSVP